MGQLRRNKKIWAGDPNCLDKRRVGQFKKKKTIGGYDQPVKNSVRSGFVADFSSEKLPKALVRMQQGMVSRKVEASKDIKSTKKPNKTQKKLHALKQKQGKTDEASGANRVKKNPENNNTPTSQKKKKSNKKKNTLEYHDNGDDSADVIKATDKYEFQSKIRPGESFRKYSARIGREKRIVMVAQAQSLTKMSQKRKTFLNDKKKSDKLKKKQTIDEGKFATKEMKYRKQEEENNKRHRDGEEEEEGEGEQPEIAKPPAKKKFKKIDSVPFGEVADRPPALLLKPKKKKNVSADDRKRQPRRRRGRR